MQFLFDLFEQIFDRIPTWIIISVFVFIGLLIATLLIIQIYKVHKGTASISFLKIKFESNNAVTEIQRQFDKLNENTNLKTQVLKLLNQALITTTEWNDIDSKEFTNKVKSFYDFFLPGIVNIITKNDNIHRISVFYKYDDVNLKILHGYGYSPEGKEKLQLSLYNSKVGHSFLNKQTYHNNDLTQDPSYKRNPKSSREYHSLVCVPIYYGDNAIGVLNIDGLNKNSFDKDDIDYIIYIANAISPILKREMHNIEESYKEEALL